MMQAAVPRYVGKQFETCPPGHRFNLYFAVWNQDWGIAKDEKAKALKSCLQLPDPSKAQISALHARQQALIDTLPQDARLSLDAKTIAPFATGLGIEHPLENGFAFLNPYGLGYLPGSSIKGVLRRAAEEMRDDLFGDGTQGWDQDRIDNLFGSEVVDRDTETTRNRGALTFWDSIPEPAGGRLAMDVMTPHYSDYYQGKASPHDAGQPNPIVFLTVPPESAFTFHITCATARLPEGLRGAWKDMLTAAFEHAFDWLGFGAKTAVGYGAMTHDAAAESRRIQEEEIVRQKREATQRDEQARREEEARLATLSPMERDIELILAGRAEGMSITTALINALKQGKWPDADSASAAAAIREKMRAERTWREHSEKRKPEKDKEYQQTRIVKRYLEGD